MNDFSQRGGTPDRIDEGKVEGQLSASQIVPVVCYEPHGRLVNLADQHPISPDLNTANPAVQAEILKIMGFWIQLGVSGFRMDAVPFVIATKGAAVDIPVEQYDIYDMLRTFREFLQWREGEAIILAEANVAPDTDMEYFGASGDRLQMMFNFAVNQTLFYALATYDTGPLVEALDVTKPRPATPSGACSCAITMNSTLAV